MHVVRFLFVLLGLLAATPALAGGIIPDRINHGDNTHSLIFTTWIAAGRNPIAQFAALSGNNKGMVWSHAPMKLPTVDQFRGMTPEQLSEYDQKVFFGVPSTDKK